MRNMLLTLAFDGTDFAGWQRQRDQPTIQGEIERCLGVMLNNGVTVHGAGRTDAGVHALGMTANFFTDRPGISPEGFRAGLNSLLPAAIRVIGVREVPHDFHARKSAVGKLYSYALIDNDAGRPTERLYSWQLKPRLSVEAVQRCLDILIGEHDFSCFEAAGSRNPTLTGGRGAVRSILRAAIKEDQAGENHYIIELAGDGFLRHMVRNIVGTVVPVGLGRLSVNRFGEILAGRDRAMAGPTAPARGLFLTEVFYTTSF